MYLIHNLFSRIVNVQNTQLSAMRSKVENLNDILNEMEVAWGDVRDMPDEEVSAHRKEELREKVASVRVRLQVAQRELRFLEKHGGSSSKIQ